MWYGCALVGVAILSSGLTAALLPRQQVVAVAAAAKSAPQRVLPALSLPRRVSGTVPGLRRKAARRLEPSATPITHGPTVTPSLYERAIAPRILRGQGCRAGRQLTNGLVVLDFGKLA